MLALLCAVTNFAWGDRWVEVTDLTSLNANGNDIIVIVDKTSGRAMSNNNGTTSAPSAVQVTLSADKSEITSTVDENLMWRFLRNEDNFQFQKYATSTNSNYLYTFNNNNGLRVGGGNDNKFIIQDNFLYNTGQQRFIGVYNNQDWRSYTSINNNIQNTVIAFYKKTTDTNTVATPTFTPADGTTFEDEQEISISCATTGATIYYTTDGGEPTTSDALYAGPFTITETTTVKAIAVKSGMTNSAVASATYTLIIPSSGYDIDFESEASAYTKWTFDNITSQYTNSGVTAHGGSKYVSTGGAATCSIKTKETVATPNSLTCYVSKQTTNTTSSTWYIQVSEDGSTWTTVESTSATDMTKGEWKVFTADLSAYSDVYVRVYYSGSTAIRLIDDLTLSTVAPDKYYVAGDWTNWADNMIEMTRNVDGSYTLDNQVVSKNQEFKIIKVASGTTAQVWCGGNADGSYWGINPNSHSDIALNVGGGKNFCMEYAGTWSITVSFDESDSPLLSVDGNWLSYYLVGDFNEWATSDSYKFKKDEETGIYTLSSIIEQEQKFKIIKMIGSEETWYGAISDGDFWVEENKVDEELSMTSPGQNFIMKLANKNQWELNYNPDNYKLTLSNYISDVAELPFTFDGGKGDIQDKAGLTNSGIGSDYSILRTLLPAC